MSLPAEHLIGSTVGGGGGGGKWASHWFNSRGRGGVESGHLIGSAVGGRGVGGVLKASEAKGSKVRGLL